METGGIGQPILPDLAKVGLFALGQILLNGQITLGVFSAKVLQLLDEFRRNLSICVGKLERQPASATSRQTTNI